jgi:hypothetical protein
VTQFEASLVVGNDPNPVPTTVAVDGSDLELAVAGQSLGKWPINSLGLERIFGGYRMTVEGEAAVLKLSDPEPFAEALAIATGSKAATRSEPEKKDKKVRKSAKPKSTRPAREPPPPKNDRPRGRRKSQEATPAPAVLETETAPKAERSVGWLDEKLDKAQKRFGKRLPDWLFTTGGLVIVLALFGMLLAKPGWFSVLFLVIAAIGMIASAVALLDQVVAVRIFRGPYTPIQGLIVSLVIGLVGIVLGVIS